MTNGGDSGILKIGEVSTPRDFAFDLRVRLFEKHDEVARYLRLSRPTVGRYESGGIKPPIEYLAFLLQCFREQRRNEGSESIQERAVFESELVAWINKLIDMHPKLYPGKAFRDWAHLCEVATEYERKRRGVGTRKLSASGLEKTDTALGASGGLDKRLNAWRQGIHGGNGRSGTEDWSLQPTLPGQAQAPHQQVTTTSSFVEPAPTAPVVGSHIVSQVGHTQGEAITERLSGSGVGTTAIPREIRPVPHLINNASRKAWHVLRRLRELIVNRRVLVVALVLGLLGLTAAVTLSVLNATIWAERLIPGQVLDELWLDSRQDLQSEVNYYVRSSRAIPEGQKVLIKVQGTYSVWSRNWWSEAPACKGKPDSQPMYPTLDSGILGINGPVGLDAEFTFAAPGWSRAYCFLQEEPPYISKTPLQFNLSDDNGWLDLAPIGAAYSPDHTYTYLVEGKGYPIQARLDDYDPADNYGKLLITVSVPR